MFVHEHPFSNCIDCMQAPYYNLDAKHLALQLKQV